MQELREATSTANQLPSATYLVTEMTCLYQLLGLEKVLQISHLAHAGDKQRHDLEHGPPGGV
eukprot:scaffold7328_cov314-Pinguiococcus_pyrenoidosus.AAC.31